MIIIISMVIAHGTIRFTGHWALITAGDGTVGVGDTTRGLTLSTPRGIITAHRTIGTLGGLILITILGMAADTVVTTTVGMVAVIGEEM